MKLRRRMRVMLAGTFITGLYSLVGSTAFAIFMSQAQLSQMNFKSVHRELMVSAQQVDNPTTFSQTVGFPGSQMLYPGMQPVKEDFWLWNKSSAGQVLTLTGQMQAGDQNWALLKDVVEVNLVHLGSSQESGWKTLAEWEQNAQPLPGGNLEDDTRRRYQLQYRLPANYLSDPDGAGPLQVGSPVGNELMDKVTNGVIFLIDGKKS